MELTVTKKDGTFIPYQDFKYVCDMLERHFKGSGVRVEKSLHFYSSKPDDFGLYRLGEIDHTWDTMDAWRQSRYAVFTLKSGDSRAEIRLDGSQSSSVSFSLTEKIETRTHRPLYMPSAIAILMRTQVQIMQEQYDQDAAKLEKEKARRALPFWTRIRTPR